MKRLVFEVTAALIEKSPSSRLDQVMAAHFQGGPNALSRSQIRASIVAGAVYVNRKRVRIASKLVGPGQRIELMLNEKAIQKNGPSQRKFAITQADILFEDQWFLAVNKAAGLPTQPTLDDARDNLYKLVEKFQKAKDPSAYVALHHRLDRDTSGVMIFAKSHDANRPLSELFSGHRMNKEYWAVVFAKDALPRKNRFTIETFLKVQKLSGKRNKVSSVKSGGDLAITDVDVGEIFKRGLPRMNGHFLRVSAWPKTGRMHQIRAHLSEQGLPLVGDPQYGGPEVKDVPGVQSRVFLHARALRFVHPFTKKEMLIEAPLPEDFKKLLHYLGSDQASQ